MWLKFTKKIACAHQKYILAREIRVDHAYWTQREIILIGVKLGKFGEREPNFYPAAVGFENKSVE